jgi:ArsR family transcriptional regulator, arsenate/arsenite/antimonite-responsive transcriptional repressor
MSAENLSIAVAVHKALAHAVRVRMLAMLRDGELCVCQLNAVIALAPSTVSAHLAELKHAGLVAERKEGRWVHYRLAAEGPAAAALTALWSALDGDPQVASDAALLTQITRLPVETICRPDFDLPALRSACCAPESSPGKA